METILKVDLASNEIAIGKLAHVALATNEVVTTTNAIDVEIIVEMDSLLETAVVH